MILIFNRLLRNCLRVNIINLEHVSNIYFVLNLTNNARKFTSAVKQNSNTQNNKGILQRWVKNDTWYKISMEGFACVIIYYPMLHSEENEEKLLNLPPPKPQISVQSFVGRKNTSQI